MRKFTFLLLSIILALPSFANDFEYYGICHTLIDEEVKTCETKVGYEDPNIKVKGDIKIPSTISNSDNNYTVTRFGDYSFSGCKGLTSVIFETSNYTL